jgi:hypothetical protein
LLPSTPPIAAPKTVVVGTAGARDCGAGCGAGAGSPAARNPGMFSPGKSCACVVHTEIVSKMRAKTADFFILAIPSLVSSVAKLGLLTGYSQQAACRFGCKNKKPLFLRKTAVFS